MQLLKYAEQRPALRHINHRMFPSKKFKRDAAGKIVGVDRSVHPTAFSGKFYKLPIFDSDVQELRDAVRSHGRRAFLRQLKNPSKIRWRDWRSNADRVAPTIAEKALRRRNEFLRLMNQVVPDTPHQTFRRKLRGADAERQLSKVKAVLVQTQGDYIQDMAKDSDWPVLSKPTVFFRREVMTSLPSVGDTIHYPSIFSVHTDLDWTAAGMEDYGEVLMRIMFPTRTKLIPCHYFTTYNEHGTPAGGEARAFPSTLKVIEVDRAASVVTCIASPLEMVRDGRTDYIAEYHPKKRVRRG